jgi:hypothetical protein
MRADRAVLVAVVGCIVATTLATGPLGLVTLTPAEEVGQDGVGAGNATVEILSTPDSVSITDSSDGQGNHHVRAPDIRVNISSLRGNPALTYSFAIDSPPIASSSVHPLGQVGKGETTLTIDRSTTDRDVENVSQVELRLVLYGDTDRTLARWEVPVAGTVQETE